MSNHKRRKQHTLIRVRDFGIEHAADFPPDSLATRLFATMSDIVDDLERHGAARSSKDGNARQGSASREEAREKLRRALVAISLTSRPIARSIPGLADKFRMPVSRADQELLDAARATLADAAPFAAEFIARQRPVDFLDDLRTLIESLETAISLQSDNVGRRVAARAAIDMNLEKGSETMADLDPIVKNRYEDQPDMLAQWTSVKHTERDPQRSSGVTTTSSSTQAHLTTTSSSASTGSSASLAAPGSSASPGSGAAATTGDSAAAS